jgi:hypothetical protein
MLGGYRRFLRRVASGRSAGRPCQLASGQPHTDRNSFVTSQHRPIWNAYNALYGASRTARYGTVNQFNRF